MEKEHRKSKNDLFKSKLYASTVLIMILFFLGVLSTIPQAHAASNPNLFVSAEHSQWNNYFAGPQVIQVVVSDPDINRLDQAYGEPTVTVNGKKLRMAQATDGNWYAYFADRNQAIAADKTSGLAGKGLDFGQFCKSTSAVSPSFSQTSGFTVARDVSGSVNKPVAATAFGTCTALTTAGGTALERVVRENKTLTPATGVVTTGQLGFADSNVWPIIQLYDFSPPNGIVVDYQKAGGDQIVTLTFDRIPTNLINATLDRASYTTNSDVFVTINDPQLNIDPTEEDSWTWGANATDNKLFYQLFDRNGAADADGNLGAQNIIGNLTTFMFNHNGKLTLNPAQSGTRVIDFQSNGIQRFGGGYFRGDPSLDTTISLHAGSIPITFIESGGVNTGVFRNWDGGKNSLIITRDDPIIRGQFANIRYNEMSQSILGGFSFGSISMTANNNTWASGQRISVTLTDGDANKNGKITEHLNLYDPAVKRLPTMKIGTPFTLSGGNATLFKIGTIHTFNGVGTASGLTNMRITRDVSQDEGFSARPVFSVNSPFLISNTGGMIVDLKTTMSNLRNTIHDASGGNSEKFKGFDFINLDLRSFGILASATGTSITNVHVYLVHNSGKILTDTGSLTSGTVLVSIANTTSLQDFINLNVTNSKIVNPSQVNNNIFSIPESDNIGIVLQFTTTGNIFVDSSGIPMVADFFSIGIKGDGLKNDQRINNGIYRWELEETGDNTGVFAGTNQYVMLNQLNIFDPNTYSTLRTINHDVKFAAIQDMLQSETGAPQVTYLDLGTGGVNAQVSAQQDIPTHTGVILFDSKTYKIADTVTIILNDQDLNVDNDLVDIYTPVLPGIDPASDTIGKTGLGTYHDGTPFGQLLQVQFNGAKWSNSGCFVSNSLTGTAGGLATSLSETGFSLVETSTSSGIFTGNFEVPDQICWNAKTKISSNGTSMTATYFDFVDSNGNTKVVTTSSTSGTTTQDHNYNIMFKSGPFTPDPGLNITGIQSADHQPNGLVHFLLQFKQTPTLFEINTLSNNHISIGPYVTGNTYIASAIYTDVTESNLNSTLNARWADVIKPDYKISYDLKNKLTPEWAIDKTGPKKTAAVGIQLQNGSDITSAISYLSSAGGRIIGVSPNVPFITTIVNIDKISEIASKDFSLYVDFIDPPLTASDDSQRSAVGVDDVQSTNPSLDGSGVKIMEYDVAQILQTHETLAGSGRVQNSDSESTSHPHSTEIAGILIGNSPTYKGMAPSAQLFGYESSDSPSETPVQWTMYNGTNDLVNDFTNAIHDNSVDLASMSLNGHVGVIGHCELLGDYTATARIIDGIIHGDTVLNSGVFKKLIFVESSGNEQHSCSTSTGTIDPPATAKNSIGVGSIDAQDSSISQFTGFGPTDDGRIKPDLVAPGSFTSNQGITVPTNTGQAAYTTDSGSSLSTPVVSGSVALLIQKYREITDNPLLLPSTAKAILIHTAQNPQGDGPDYEYGWGIPKMVDAIQLINDNESHGYIHEGQVEDGNERPFSFASLGPYVKATLAWDDPPGVTLVNPTLVNNLDVKLVDSSNHIFDQPFTCRDGLTTCNSVLSHIQGDDQKNNVKMVVAHGIVGSWTAIVTGKHISSGSQHFTLVVTSYSPSSSPSLPSPPIITSPAYGSSLSGPIQIGGSATSGNSVQVYVDGAVVFPLVSVSGGNWNTPTFNPGPGTHTIYAIQRSTGLTAHNSLVSNTVKISSSVYHAPVISSPTSGTSPASPISVSGTADSPSDVSVFVNMHLACTAVVDAAHHWSCPTVTLNPGNNDITAEQSALPSSTPVSVFYSPLTITSPHNGDSLSTNPVTIHGTSSNHADQISIAINAATVPGHPTFVGNNWSMDVILGSGPNTITATQSGSSPVSISVTFSPPLDAMLHITKTVDNGNFGGNHGPTDFTINAISGSTTIPLTINGDTHLPPGTWTITETGPDGYTPKFSSPPTFTQDCIDNNDHTGSITLGAGDHKTCIIANSHCLIATAAFGSELSPQVKYLRDFRDYRILSTHDGSSFMTAFNYWYYSFSPSVADFERTQPLMQLVVRDSIYPLLGILTVSEKSYSLIPGEYGSLLAGMMASSMIGTVYFWPLALALPQIRQNKKFNTKLALLTFIIACVSVIISINMGNSSVMMITTSFVVLSLMAIFSIISAKLIVKMQKNLRLYSLLKRNSKV